MVSTVQSVGLTSSGNGVSLAVPGVGGTNSNPILILKSLIAGPGMTVTASGSDVTLTATGLPPLTSLITAQFQWAGGSSPGNQPIFTAAYPLVVTAIIGRVEYPSTGQTATLTPVKVANGTPIASGSALTSGPLDGTATAYTNQVLPLVNNITTLTLAVGDSLGIQATGTWPQASGSITIHMAPAPI